MALDGQTDSAYGYSFILSDIYHQPTPWVEHYHRHRAQIEERIKDIKTGQALRHLPSGDINANRVWLTASLLALNLTAWCCDLSPAAAASGNAPDKRTPLRRHAQTLRRILFNVPARIIRTGRRLILRLPAGYPHTDIFQSTLDAIYSLAPP
jgi:Transposase DDE domain group 1